MTDPLIGLSDQSRNLQSRLQMVGVNGLEGFERTPITRIGHLPSLQPAQHELEVYLKRDGLLGQIGQRSTSLYGGNKLRKLKYIIPHAASTSAQSISTTGSEGSHHVLSTLSVCQWLGIDCHVALTPQTHSEHSRLIYQQIKQRATSVTSISDHRETYQEDILHWRAQRESYMIPTGGSSPLGVYGMIEGVIELIEQIHEGEIPIPQRIYIAAASGSSLAGLLLGLSMYWPKTYGDAPQVRAIRVAPAHLINRKKVRRLYKAVSLTLHHSLAPPPFELISRYLGEGYALSTPGSVHALEWGKRQGVILDPTYTAKAFHALVHQEQEGTDALQPGPLLFWHTLDETVFNDSVK